MNGPAGPLGAGLLVGIVWLGLGGVALEVHHRRSDRVAVGRLSARTASAEVPQWFRRAAGFLVPGIAAEPFWSGAIVGVTVVLGGLAVLAPVPVAMVVPVGVGAGLLLRRHGHHRMPSPAAYRADLLTRLADVHASLSSGAALGPSLSTAGLRAGPCAVDLASLDSAVRSGCSVQAAIDEWSAQRPGVGVDLVASALAIAGTTGASQAAAVGAVAATLRRRQAQAREAQALASQARASAAVLVILPLGFAVVVAILDPRVSSFLVGTAAGWGCLIGGLALDAVGGWWMAALVRRVR